MLRKATIKQKVPHPPQDRRTREKLEMRRWRGKYVAKCKLKIYFAMLRKQIERDSQKPGIIRQHILGSKV